MPNDEMTDLRCPVSPRRLFARMNLWQIHAEDGNVIEIACDDCKHLQRRRMGQTDVVRVLHRFNMLGECIGTEVVRGRR